MCDINFHPVTLTPGSTRIGSDHSFEYYGSGYGVIVSADHSVTVTYQLVPVGSLFSYVVVCTVEGCLSPSVVAGNTPELSGFVEVLLTHLNTRGAEVVRLRSV